MNMGALMAQAKKIQADLEKTTKEIDNKNFVYENDNILVEAKGTYKVNKINIKNDSLLEDREILEDMILVAINDIISQIKKEKESKLGKYSAGLGGLF